MLTINKTLTFQRFSANQIGFQGEPVNLDFLQKAKSNMSDAQALLRQFQNKTHDATGHNLDLIEGALRESGDDEAKFYLGKTVKYLKQKLGIISGQ